MSPLFVHEERSKRDFSGQQFVAKISFGGLCSFPSLAADHFILSRPAQTSTHCIVSRVPGMPPRPMSSSAFGPWRCLSCTVRSFSSRPARLQVGPEHPRFIEIPEPPQQTAPVRPRIKGTLPVPRQIFSGIRAQEDNLKESLEKSTRAPSNPRAAEAGSRQEWKMKLAEHRRRNLKEGVTELNYRMQRSNRIRDERSARNAEEREEALNRPEREDERLTAPSHNLDLEELMHGGLRDPTRGRRLKRMKARTVKTLQTKERQRMEHLHTLYTKARSFIVTQKQLDDAIETAFGTEENPALFSTDYSSPEEAYSVWALGQPDRLQDIMNRVNKVAGAGAATTPTGYQQVEINRERIKKVAEILTGGEMGGEK